jgi:arylsulfatase A-like enzyme
MQAFRRQRRFSLPALAGRMVRLETRHQRKAEQTTALALDWLSDRAGFPFFLWIHYYDPHVPYEPPPPFDALYLPAGGDRQRPAVLRPVDADYWIAQYDGEITYTDRQVGRILEALKRFGVYDETLLIVTSDHGESFGHGYYYQHTAKLYESLIHIPLIMRYPPLIRGGARSDALVESIDLFPTILDILGIKSPSDISGKTLMPLIRHENRAAPRGSVFAGTDVEAPETHVREGGRVRFPALRMNRPVWLGDQGGGKGLRSIRTGRWKLILDQRRGTVELFDLENDPGELNDLAADEKEIAAALLEELRVWLAYLERSAVPEKTVVLDEDMKEGLEALGYLN